MSSPVFDYARSRRSRLKLSAVDHFWSKVDQRAGPDGCWPWTGHIHKVIGYGCCPVPNSDGEWATEFTHRVALFLTTGEWSERYKTCVRHLCDNPPCCNPAHLRLGSLKDNTADARRAGTLGPKNPTHGENHHKAKLTASDITIIRERMDAGESSASVAIDYGVAGETVRAAWKRQTWRHIP